MYCIDPQFLTAFLSLSKNGDIKKSHRKKWRWRRRRRRRRRRKRQRPRHHIHDTRSTLRGWSPPALAHVGVDVWSGDWRVPRRWTQKQTTWGPTMKRIGCVASSCILYIYIYIYVFRIVPRSLPWDLKNGHVSPPNQHVGTVHVLLHYWMLLSYSSCARESHPTKIIILPTISYWESKYKIDLQNCKVVSNVVYFDFCCCYAWQNWYFNVKFYWI